jgi:hypothetical protein
MLLLSPPCAIDSCRGEGLERFLPRVTAVKKIFQEAEISYGLSKLKALPQGKWDGAT